MNLYRLVVAFLLFFFFQAVSSQYYAPGTDPLNFKWRRINTPHVRIVFADDMTPYALRLAELFDSLNYAGGYSLDHKPRKIDILLHSRTVYSNGFVSWAPRRSEFFTTPSQDLGTMDWLHHLAIHEYRHVVQMDKLNRGLTRWLGYLFGEQAVGAVGGLYLPFWFLEGDAVVTETAMTGSGRGREPFFEQELRAQMIERGIYSMSKAYLGSYRDYVPNHYNMGYLLVAGVRNRYGSQVWSKAVEHVGRHPWSLTPFNRSLKMSTGHGKNSLYNSVFAQWQQEWKTQDSLLGKSAFAEVTSPGSDFVNYNFARSVAPNHLVVEKSGPGLDKSFVDIDIATGKEKVVVVPGLRNDEPFDAVQNRIVWSEMDYHWRWENQMFSNIYVYDSDSGQKLKLTRRGRYFSPSFVSGGNIAAVSVSESNLNSIAILDGNGAVVNSFPTPGNDFPMTPVFSAATDEVVVVLQGSADRRISALNIGSGTWRDITRPTAIPVRNPSVSNGVVYFSSSETGIENIFKVPLEGGEAIQLTSERFGATSPIALNNDTLLYSRYSSSGYGLAKAYSKQPQQQSWRVVSPSEKVVNKLVGDELPSICPDSISHGRYEVKPYSRFNLFNFHSWAPVAVNPIDEEIASGLSIMSQNLLGTMVTVAGWNTAKQDELEKYYLSVSYRGWYPVLSLDVTHGDSRMSESFLGVTSASDTVYVENSGTMKQSRLKGSVSLPVNISSGRYYRYLQPYVGVEYYDNSGYIARITPMTRTPSGWIPKGASTQQIYGSGEYADMQYGVAFGNLRRGTLRDVGTRWGQSLQFKYRHTPWGATEIGSMWGIAGRLYLPGFMKYHQIMVNCGYQKKYQGENYATTTAGYLFNYLYSDFLSFPRGYSKYRNDELETVSVNYHFPIFNPDFNIGSFLYLKRLKANIFYDFAHGSFTWKRVNGFNEVNGFNISSFGTEIMANTHFFQFIVPVDLGCRLSWLTSGNELAAELMLSVNMASFTGNR